MASSPAARRAWRSFGLAAPAIAWLVVFFLLPLTFVLVASVLSRGPGGVPVAPPTLEHYERTFTTFGPVLLRTALYAALTTVLCLLVGYPLAMFITRRRDPRLRLALLFLVLLPFWTNFLVRTYALVTIIGRDGFLSALLQAVGLLTEPFTLMFTPAAVVLGLVYGYLPFMVLPLAAAIDRLDRRLVEAAHDLGANDWQAFWRIVLPLTWPGALAGSMLVFIPTLGAFITPDLLGGTRGLMIGNLVQSQFRGRGNIPLGSAISVVLLVLVFAAVLVHARARAREAR